MIILIMALDKLIKDSKLTEAELKALLKSRAGGDPSVRHKYEPAKSHYRFGVLSDTHIGSNKFSESLFEFAGDTFRKQKIKDVYHVGDILEGMSGRPGHVYELNRIGFTAQMDYAEQLWRDYMKGINTHGIIGNHDGWFMKKGDMGANPGVELERRLEGSNSPFEYLGDSEADVHLGKIRMKLFHPADGTAYATSYKLQKLIESFDGGDKPNIVLEGHYHKSLYMNCRNVHGLECGTVCGQTGWMRGKKIPAHMGFWIVDVGADSHGVNSFNPTFYPGYTDSKIGADFSKPKRRSK